MTASGVDPIIPLSIVTIVGLAFTYLGYDLFDLFLTWIGALLGAGIVVVAGWVVVGSGGDLGGQLIAAGVLALFGALIGAGIVSALARFAIVVGAFIASTLAGFLIFLGEELIRTEAIPENPEAADPEVVEEVIAIEQLMEGSAQEGLILTLVIGLTGAALAYKFYPVVIAAATSVFGAVLLGSVLPLWQQGVIGGGELAFELSGTFNGWTGVALVTGFVFQSYRHSEMVEKFVDSALDVVR
jgi:uncharacterized membrane protein YeaQ/YmgE (transglycosylase-associated protein family)